MAESEEDDPQILQAVLSTAFSPGHVRKQSASSSAVLSGGATGQAPPPGSGPDNAESVAEAQDDSWKAEYEANLQSWRELSAVAREKAEKERARWEAIRAAEKQESARRGVDGGQTSSEQDAGWETIGKRSALGSPGQRTEVVVTGPVDAKHSARIGVDTTSQPSASSRHSRENTTDDTKLSLSQKWEPIPASPTSSYPSMSFPDNSNTSSREIDRKTGKTGTQVPPQSATLTIFDSTLPARTRVSALLSSLAINMLLPFVNGVMLGFGEIFARTVVIGWLGWRMPGSLTTNLGIRSSRTRPI